MALKYLCILLFLSYCFYFTASTVFSSSKEHNLNPLDEFKSYLKHVYKHKMHAANFEEPSLKHYLPFNLFVYYVRDPEKPYDWSQSRRLRDDEESISLSYTIMNLEKRVPGYVLVKLAKVGLSQLTLL